MSAQEEFFNLISYTLSEQQVARIREKCNELEPCKSIDVESFYINLCGLFYYSNKNFDNFMLNLSKRKLLSDYTKMIIHSQQKREKQEVQIYDNIRTTILNATSSTIYNSLLNKKESFSYAITNAITKEIINLQDQEESLEYYRNCKQILDLKAAIDSNKRITRICFDIDRTASYAIIDNKTSISSFWNDLITYSAYRMPIPENIEFELQQLEKRVKYAHKIIAYRICLVFVHYGILNKTTESEKFILKNKSGEFVSLQQGVMTEIYHLIKKLHIDLKMREGEFNDIKDSKYTADKIKNLLRAGKNTPFDHFSYEDINDSLWSCFQY